jgi:hypothetical protein
MGQERLAELRLGEIGLTNWAGSRDKNTILLDFRNHYNKKENKCFGFVEWHYHSNFAGPEEAHGRI